MKLNRRIWLYVILIISVLLRVGVAFYLGDDIDAPSMLSDQRSYHALGERLIEGHGFSFDEGWYPFTPAETPTAHWSFLYSLFVAAVYAIFGVHPLAARLAGAVIGGALLPWMVYRLSRRLFPGQEQVALLAAFCAAIYAFFMLYAATLMTETFYIVALLWSLERAMALAETPTLRLGLSLGVGLGITALLRQSVLPIVILLFVWLLAAGWRAGRLRSMLAALALAGPIMLLFILPFTIRNYLVYDEFLLLNSNAGYAMYSAQHPMHGIDFQEYAAAPIPDDLWVGLSEAQMDRELMRRGIGFVLDEPGRYLLLSLSRVLDYFEFWPTDTSLLHNLGRLGSFAIFMPFMIAGIWMAIRRRRPLRKFDDWAHFFVEPAGIALTFMLAYCVLHVLTWAMPRYRLPSDAVAIPFAALAIAALIQRVKSTRLFGLVVRDRHTEPARPVTPRGLSADIDKRSSFER